MQRQESFQQKSQDYAAGYNSSMKFVDLNVLFACEPDFHHRSSDAGSGVTVAGVATAGTGAGFVGDLGCTERGWMVAFGATATAALGETTADAWAAGLVFPAIGFDAATVESMAVRGLSSWRVSSTSTSS